MRSKRERVDDHTDVVLVLCIAEPALRCEDLGVRPVAFGVVRCVLRHVHRGLIVISEQLA